VVVAGGLVLVHSHPRAFRPLDPWRAREYTIVPSAARPTAASIQRQKAIGQRAKHITSLQNTRASAAAAFLLFRSGDPRPGPIVGYVWGGIGGVMSVGRKRWSMHVRRGDRKYNI